MKAKHLIKILEMVDPESEVIVDCQDWSLRDKTVIVSSASFSVGKTGELQCTVHYEPEEKDNE
jgi:hypothetical protein